MNIKDILVYLIGNLLYFVSYLIPKSKKIWVFGSNAGYSFSGNPKYLFNYISINNTDIKVVWLTRNKKIKDKLISLGKLVYHPYSIKGIWNSCRAAIGVHSHGMNDINPYTVHGMKIVQTWHGIAMKPILLSDPKEEEKKKRKQLVKLSLLFPFLRNNYDFNNNLIVCSSSPFVSEMNKKVFGSKSPIKVTGYPRLDGLFNSSQESNILGKIKIEKAKGNYIGIYMPTYRRKHEFNIIEFFIDNLPIIDTLLQKNKQVLFLKIHKLEAYTVKNRLQHKNVFLINDDEIDDDIYSILNQFDFLISDYSSIIFDFLILKRPIFLLTPDREDYIRTNGRFTYDYLDLELPIFDNWKELLGDSSLADFLLLKPKIELLSKKFHTNCDGQSSYRLFDAIVKDL